MKLQLPFTSWGSLECGVGTVLLSHVARGFYGSVIYRFEDLDIKFLSGRAIRKAYTIP